MIDGLEGVLGLVRTFAELMAASSYGVILALFLVGFVAGFVDAIAGGGGLLTVPALLLAGLPPEQAMGTNKGQSIFGSSTSLLRYFHSPLLDRRRALQAIVPALVASSLGTLVLVYGIPNAALRPLVMILLLAVAAFMIFYRPPAVHAPPRSRSYFLSVAVAFAIAFYDGFFGPGTGMFLIQIYALAWRDPLDAASANAKVVNCCSNWGSFLTFAVVTGVVWKYALPMGMGQLIGGWTGAHVTVRSGRGLVRYVVIALSVALVLRLAHQLYTGS